MMVTPQVLLHIWETGERLHPVDRALLLLSMTYPSLDRDGWAAVSIGQRDGALMDLYMALFGPDASCTAICPQCQESLEFDLHLPDLRGAPRLPPDDESYQLDVDEHVIQYRLTNSFDQAALLKEATSPALEITQPFGATEQARQQLLERCVISATVEGTPTDVAMLPSAVVDRLVDEMAEADPLAIILLNLTCPACDTEWQSLFDIMQMLWPMIARQAQQMLDEVHLLARAYGWSEASIFALSTTRRRAYLQRVG